jgi:hypothetical protein
MICLVCNAGLGRTELPAGSRCCRQLTFPCSPRGSPWSETDIRKTAETNSKRPRWIELSRAEQCRGVLERALSCVSSQLLDRVVASPAAPVQLQARLTTRRGRPSISLGRCSHQPAIDRSTASAHWLLLLIAHSLCACAHPTADRTTLSLTELTRTRAQTDAQQKPHNTQRPLPQQPRS